MKKINFGKDWSFSLNGGDKRTVNLPHDFSIEQKRSADSPSRASGGYFLDGLGQYEKSFVSKRGKKYFLMCDGAFGVTDVYINASLVYTNKYAYNSFCAELSEYLRYDKENEIKIVVNNKHQPNARWYTGSGLYRDVFLCECDGSYLDPFGAFVSTDRVIDSCAYMSSEIRFHADENGRAELKLEVYADNASEPVYVHTKCVYATKGENTVNHKFALENAKIWDVDSPNMYSIKVSLSLGRSKDSDTGVFGIRTVDFNNENGFLLNGRPIKLRGGCIHHDHGPLGACAYPEAEYRRIARLKKAGFNSIRLSHNPQSQHLYDACDRLGMLVIDELFDYWREGKQIDDFHTYFDDNWDKWTELIVRRNRPHPSIIMWSTGNEIPQKTGRGDGYRIARDIANKIRSIDTSRPLTHALCSLWDNREEFELENATKELGADKMDYFAEATRITADTVDIVGYNYLEYRIDRDLIRFPNRLIVNTETFPICAYTTIKQLLSNPRILGDYVWTAWDYFGETGIGHVDYNEQGEGFRLLDYPYHIANCGDIDICGERKPQSYYREIAWGLRKEPYIATRHPDKVQIKHFPSAWGFYECEHTWNYPDCEGKDIEIYVFAEADKVILEINGEKIDEISRTDNGVYLFKAKYFSGEVRAIALVDGKEYSSSVKTEGAPSKIALLPEKSYFTRGTKRPEESLVYVNVEIRDENGELCTQDARSVHYEAQGADILGVASGELTSEEMYKTDSRRVFGGKAVVVLKKHKGKDKAVLKASTDNMQSQIEI